MIDLDTEHVMTFPRAGASITGTVSGRPVKAPTIWRWADEGLAGVRLEACYRRGVRVTSKEALERFFDRVAEAKTAIREERARAKREKRETAASVA